MKKTLIALMALASVAAADTYTSSTPGKSGAGAQGGYYGFTLAPADATYLTTDIPADVTELNLDSLTILTRTGSVSTNDMKVAVYAYEGDNKVILSFSKLSLDITYHITKLISMQQMEKAPPLTFLLAAI